MDPRINTGVKKDKRTFFDIAMQDYPISQSGGSLNLKGGTKISHFSFRNFFDYDKLNVYVNLDDIVHDENYNELGYIKDIIHSGEFDAGDQLKQEIFIISESLNIPSEFYWDVLSDVLHQLNFNDCRTMTLIRLVYQFTFDCFDSTGKNFNQLRSELDLKKIKSHNTPSHLMTAAQRRRANRLSKTRSVQSHHSQVMRTNSVPVIGQNSVLKKGHAERAKNVTTMRLSNINARRGIRGGRSTRKKYKNN
jgi:hypothetical protein